MKGDRFLPIVIGLLTFGGLWGFLEAVTFAGMLHKYWEVFFPYHLCPCFLMAAAFGSLVLGASLAVHKSPLMLIGIGLVATVSSWYSVPFLPDFVRADYYGAWIPAATAIVVTSIALAAASKVSLSRIESSVAARVGLGLLSGLIASTVFILVTEYGDDPGIVAVLGYARPLPDFLMVGGLIWMAIQAMLLPVGYRLGEIWAQSGRGVEARPGLARFAAVVAVLIGGSAIAVAVGLQ